jgi:hypothetical protein
LWFVKSKALKIKNNFKEVIQMTKYENTYEVNEILGTTKTRIVVSGKVNISYDIDTYVFNQKIGTFLNSDDEYRLKFLEENAEKHIEPRLNPYLL